MASTESAQLLGLAGASMAGAFTTSEAGIDLIYDSMTVEWNNGGPDPTRMPSTDFAIIASPAARGRTIQLGLRGFAQPVAGASIAVQVGGVSIGVQPDEENYYSPVSASLSADADTTPVTVTLELPEPADDGVAMLALDSVAVSLADCTEDDGR